MNDVMKELSGCVLDEGGVLVDYVGDEVLAMWGAPQDQPDQAERAVRAALAMLAALPASTPLAGVLGASPPSASASTPARPRSATPARSLSSSTARWATPSTWAAVCRV